MFKQGKSGNSAKADNDFCFHNHCISTSSAQTFADATRGGGPGGWATNGYIISGGSGLKVILRRFTNRVTKSFGDAKTGYGADGQGRGTRNPEPGTRNPEPEVLGPVPPPPGRCPAWPPVKEDAARYPAPGIRRGWRWPVDAGGWAAKGYQRRSQGFAVAQARAGQRGGHLGAVGTPGPRGSVSVGSRVTVPGFVHVCSSFWKR